MYSVARGISVPWFPLGRTRRVTQTLASQSDFLHPHKEHPSILTLNVIFSLPLTKHLALVHAKEHIVKPLLLLNSAGRLLGL